MSEWAVNDGIEDVGDAEENKLSPFTGREGTIYLIDVSIFENREDFYVCLDCIEADLLKRILINARDLVSVIFYNTQHSPPPSDQLSEGEDLTTVVPPNCAVFIPLKPLSKDLIQYFKNFKNSQDLFNFEQKYGTSGGSCFSEALWLCSRLLIRCNYRLTNPQIVLFTNNELPHESGTEEQHMAFVRAKDLFENGITIDLVPLVDEFDMERFYKEFLFAVRGEEIDYDSPADQRFKYINRVNRSDYRKSCLRHIKFELSEGVSLSCDIYSMTRTAKKPNAVKMFRENREVVVAKRSYYVAEQNPNNEADVTERKVLTSQLYKSQVICGKEVLFKPEEIITMKTIQSTGLRLLGFKPIEQLKPRWMIKHCLFMYPNDKPINGSTTLFRALWQQCLEKKKYALCTITLRRFTPPKYVALVPQTADQHGADGFGIIFLPVETNIGALDGIVKPLPEPTPEQVDLLEKLCKKLRFKYDVKTFSNPALQWFFTNLEATVYDEEENPVVDVTVPDVEEQDEKLGPFLEHIDEEFGSEDTASGSRGKRGNDGETGGTRAKASKKDLSPNDVEEAIRNGRMNAVTVDHIKEFFRSRNAQPPSKANKQVLFERARKLID